MKIFLKLFFTLYFLIALVSIHLFAQHQKVSSTFQKDTIFIGEEVKYTLSYFHPSNYQVIFPDSNYNYYPFEIIRKRTFNSSSTNDWTLDSVVYYLRTFSIDSNQSLSLPIILLNQNGDTTIIKSNISSVVLKRAFKPSQSSPQLLPDTAIIDLPAKFNYPYFLIFGLGNFVLIFFLLYLFRKSIIKRYKLFVLRKNHINFTKNFEKLEKNILLNKDLIELEVLVAEWKKYLSKLEESPINTYTTTEIISSFRNQELGNTLQYLDKCIYGNTTDINFQQPILVLKRFSVQQFQKKRKEARANG
ncbi:MAG: hypothetical protein EAZ07_04325 [Cytophagales bacterium]|nr:MAG: hypothetical protein EAZ07_04325 [Cytophagales bacterium]